MEKLPIAAMARPRLGKAWFERGCVGVGVHDGAGKIGRMRWPKPVRACGGRSGGEMARQWLGLASGHVAAYGRVCRRGQFERREIKRPWAQLIEKREWCGPHASIGEKEIHRACDVATGRASCNDLTQLNSESDHK